MNPNLTLLAASSGEASGASIVMSILFGVIGGLGLFLYGMHLMSESLREASGAKLKNALSKVTKWPVTAMLVGIFITVLLQSSSATTVMTVGLVHAGLLSLKQAVGIVIGCNIGTTTTAFIVAFLGKVSVTKIALPVAGIGFFMSWVGKREKLRIWGRVLLGFGILFVGLSGLKDAMEFLPDEATKAFFEKMSVNPLLGILAGCIATVILQSSSATVAVVQVLAFHNVITLDQAIPIILGENIGTTITAQLASLQTNVTARRVAWAHTLFNVIGVSYMIVFVWVGWYSEFIEWISGKAIGAYGVLVGWIGEAFNISIDDRLLRENTAFKLAMAHCCFNVINAAVHLFFINKLTLIVERLVKSDGSEEEFAGPEHLEEHLIQTPVLALDQAKLEIVRMVEVARDAVEMAYKSFFKPDKKAFRGVSERENFIDGLQADITNYVVKISAAHPNLEAAEMIPSLLHTVNDIERIGDHAENISELARRASNNGIAFPPKAEREIEKMHEITAAMIDDIVIAIARNDAAAAKRVLENENRLNELQQQYKQSHTKRWASGKHQVFAGIIFFDFVDVLEKIGDHASNIAQASLRSFRYGKKSSHGIRDNEPEETKG